MTRPIASGSRKASAARRLEPPPVPLLARGLVAARGPLAGLLAPVHSRRPGRVVGRRGRRARVGGGAAPRILGRAGSWASFASRQSVFLASHFEPLSPFWLASSHRLATAYLNGMPGTAGVPEFDECFERLRRHRERIDRVQVTHAEMHELVLSAGVDPECVFRVPLGIDLEHFPLVDAERRARARESLGLPASAFVVGSFQKDGAGWGEGLQPKLVKGPDVFLSVAERVREAIPELAVLLTGPARGFVRGELERRSIPCSDVRAGSRGELASAYHSLDIYVVSSRQEGGADGPRFA